ncbi:hypothetical protein ABZ766_03130 [Streptomyces sp. NPDC006670]|uniref:hypothetical protein n=1 Tax=Streptomyces sp. NPDC006670 TaxID=3154476 RepID=UPI0033F12C1E
MTMLEERSRRWQGTGGPEEWQAAWDRAREILGRVWPDGFFAYDRDPDRGELADGAAGLATLLYILARETGAHPRDITRGQVEDLVMRREGETDPDVVRRWEAQLIRLGHDLDDAHDPVAARWRILRTDNSPSDDAPDWVAEDASRRWGIGALEGIRYVLSPSLRDRLDFAGGTA